MKKVLFAALLLIGTSSAFSQVSKNQWLVGGTAGFNSYKQGEDQTTSFNISPNVGYFFINNFAGGLRLDLGSSKDKGAEDSYSSFSVAPFVRYYFLPAAQKVNLFADASYGFGKEGYGDDKMSASTLGIAAGPALFLSPNTALEFALSYRSTKIKDVDDRANNIGFNVGFQIHLGGKK